MANVKFKLEMKDGTKVRTLADLKEHGDSESVIAAFQTGLLMKWLDNLTLEDTANKLRAIDKNAEDWQQQVFAILGIECNADNEVDEDAAARLREKKELLGQLTPDKTIINRASQTAFDQADLAELLHQNVSVIYLARNKKEPYQIRVKYKNKTYVGLNFDALGGMPKVEIDAKSREELDRNGIKFDDNVILPVHLQTEAKSQADAEEPRPTKKARTHSSRITVEELRDIFNAEFGLENSARPLMSGGSYIENGMGGLGASLGSVSFAEAHREIDKIMRHAAMSGSMRNELEEVQKEHREILENENQKPSVWSVATPYELQGSIGKALDAGEAVKSSILRRICKGKYTEENLVHICVSEDRSEGWAFTIDSFCFCINGESAVIPYSDMRAVVPRVVTDYDRGEGKGIVCIVYEDDAHHESKILKGKTIEGVYEHIASYLAKVGDFYDLQLDGSQAEATLANVMDIEELRRLNAMNRLIKSDGEY